MRIVIGLGGNRGDVPSAFARALAGLAEHADVLACSGLWRTAPVGPPQAEFVNAAVLLEGTVHPAALLALCQRLEEEAGRDRTTEARFGPRTLDLDLLIAPGLVVSTRALTVPHPRLAGRRFALAPAVELAPGWVHPRLRRTLGELAAAPEVAAQRCERTGEFPRS